MARDTLEQPWLIEDCVWNLWESNYHLWELVEIETKIGKWVCDRERVDFEGSGDLLDYSRCEVPVSGML